MVCGLRPSLRGTTGWDALLRQHVVVILAASWPPDRTAALRGRLEAAQSAVGWVGVRVRHQADARLARS